MRRIVLVALMGATVVVLGGSGSAGARVSLKQVVAQHLHAHWVSQGARGWLNPPKVGAGAVGRLVPRAGSLSFGSNVDAASTVEDLLAGQSETAIDATTTGRVMVAWNDATGFAFLQGNRLQASLTGVGYSTDGGASYTDLVGLRNPNPISSGVEIPPSSRSTAGLTSSSGRCSFRLSMPARTGSPLS